MLRESDATFSAAQVLTATADSTNYVDRKALGDGTDGAFIVVTCPIILDSAANGATLTINVQSDEDSGFATALVTNLSVVIAEASLTAGIIAKIPLPLGLKQFVQMNYAVTGENFTTGTISSFVVLGIDNDNV